MKSSVAKQFASVRRGQCGVYSRHRLRFCPVRHSCSCALYLSGNGDDAARIQSASHSDSLYFNFSFLSSSKVSTEQRESYFMNSIKLGVWCVYTQCKSLFIICTQRTRLNRSSLLALFTVQSHVRYLHKSAGGIRVFGQSAIHNYDVIIVVDGDARMRCVKHGIERNENFPKHKWGLTDSPRARDTATHTHTHTRCVYTAKWIQWTEVTVDIVLFMNCHNCRRTFHWALWDAMQRCNVIPNTGSYPSIKW